jgi:hypothetical protein
VALTLTAARRAVTTGALTADLGFDVLAAIGRHGAFNSRDEARDLLIRLLEQRDTLAPGLEPILQGLVREHGLFPYLREVNELALADHLAYEAHRPVPAPGDNIIFHAEQAVIYERLLAGENVVLSAPTSFGKTLVVDAVLAARPFRNAAVIVPTIALMDESRRRLAHLAHIYKIITHGSQLLGERNLFVMTQERLLEIDEMPQLDFFVVDEFYKLDPAHSDERSTQLNIAFQRLMSTGAQFYLLGPNITGLTTATAERLRATFISTGFTTVATDIERVSVPAEQLPDALAATCQEVGGGTIIFCRSPKRTREVAEWLMARGVGGGRDLAAAADWIGEAYHREWLVGRALRQGIGVHHGRLPRALGHHFVRLFNEGRLPYLLVTSTLIEGVNTSARTVIVLDNKIATRKYDYFTFANIRGRSGRMFKHFVGRVIVFNPEPKSAELTVDVPVVSQSENMSDELLLQVPEDQLSDRNSERLRPYHEQSLVRIATLRKNVGLSPARQLEAARQLANEPRRFSRALAWSGSYPTANQVRELGTVLFTLTGSSGTVRTAAQLGTRVNIMRHHGGDLRGMVADQVARGAEPDEAIEDALDFARNWAQFKIPRALTAISALAGDVLSRSGSSLADTSVFAGELENMFLPPYATVLEEYGLPVPVTLKLVGELQLNRANGLDDVLARLRQIGSPAGLGAFEREMLADTQQSL